MLKRFCIDNNLIFEMMKIKNYPNNRFTEEAARDIRYNFFDEVIHKYNSDILFTAHHGDDQIETILMRLIRGSSLKGYAGISNYNSDRGYIIARPLLFLTKDEIITYLKERHINFSIDYTNKDTKYTRNRYREKILPELKKENINVHSKFNEFNNKILLAHSYIKKQADVIFSKIVIDNKIDVIKFNKLDKIIKIYILEDYLKNIYKNKIGLINNKHMELLIKNILLNKNININLPDNKIAMVEYGVFSVVNVRKNKAYEFTFDNYVKLPNEKVIKVDNNTKLTSNYVIHLNSKDIKLPFIVRTRKPGDFMKVKNMSGTKKVNDIFIDCKVSKEERDNYPIVLDSTGEIIWIPGIKKSHLARKNDEKYDIILKYD